MADSRKVSNKVEFVNYIDTDGIGRTAMKGEDIDTSTLGKGEEDRIAAAGGFADTPIDLTRVGSDMDGNTTVDDRALDDAKTPVPVANGGVEPLDDETSSYSDTDTYKKSDLEDLAESRGLTVEGTGANGAVTRKDLEAALEADDNAAAPATA